MTRILTVLAYIVFSILVFTPSSYAEDSPEGVVTIPDMWLTFVVASVLPIVVGVVKARFASSRVGAMLLLFVSVVAGWLTSLQATGGSFEPKAAVTSIFISFVTAAGFHYGFLKPAGVTGNNGIVQKAIPQGVGSSTAT